MCSKNGSSMLLWELRRFFKFMVYLYITLYFIPHGIWINVQEDPFYNTGQNKAEGNWDHWHWFIEWYIHRWMKGICKFGTNIPVQAKTHMPTKEKTMHLPAKNIRTWSYFKWPHDSFGPKIPANIPGAVLPAQWFGRVMHSLIVPWIMQWLAKLFSSMILTSGRMHLSPQVRVLLVPSLWTKQLVDKPTSVQEDSAEVPDNSQPKKLRSQTSLNVDQLWDVGKNNKDKQLKARVDHVIMWLICVCGLVPNIIDLPKWRELMHLVNRPTILHQLIFLLINIFHTRPSMFVANKSRICIVSKTSCWILMGTQLKNCSQLTLSMLLQQTSQCLFYSIFLCWSQFSSPVLDDTVNWQRQLGSNMFRQHKCHKGSSPRDCQHHSHYARPLWCSASPS